MKSITSHSSLRPFWWCVASLVLGCTLAGCGLPGVTVFIENPEIVGAGATHREVGGKSVLYNDTLNIGFHLEIF